MSSDLLIYHHALSRQRVLISLSLFHVIAHLLQTGGTRSSMTLVKSLYSVGLHLSSDWIWWRVLIPTRETLLRRNETIGCENALRTVKSQRPETADISSSSHCEDSGTCRTIDYTSIGKSTSPAKNMCCPWWNNSILAREEISSFSLTLSLTFARCLIGIQELSI